MALKTKLSTRVYRALLRVLPKDFREKWGADAEELMAYRLATTQGTAGRMWIWARALWDVLVNGTVERLSRVDPVAVLNRE
jgi:hypothetical protein